MCILTTADILAIMITSYTCNLECIYANYNLSAKKINLYFNHSGI